MSKQVFHFFATSAAEWHIDSDIKRLIKFMDKQGFEYGLWYVPVDINADYEIKYFVPQVEGSAFLGKYQVK
jgi:hypothetical protein